MDTTKVIQEEAEALLAKMVNAHQVEVTEDAGVFQVLIKAEDEAPTVIGRHGETIRAIQKILEVILFKKLGAPVSILLNVNDYREKQKERLQGIAEQSVQRVLASGQATQLRGFSSFERKIIHEFVTQTYPELLSHSDGEGRDRILIIEQKKKEGEEVENSQEEEV